MTYSGVVDLNEYGVPVSDEYRRLGAGAISENEEGPFVRFEPGFGLNVHIGVRIRVAQNSGDINYGPFEWKDVEKMCMSIGTWDRLCELVDEWRARQTKTSEIDVVIRPRLRACVEKWPDCVDGEYNPACCRFPKSCSCSVYSDATIKPHELESTDVR